MASTLLGAPTLDQSEREPMKVDVALPWLMRGRNDGVGLDHRCRPPTHLRAKVNSSRRRCTRCRSEVSARRICDHAQGCSKYPTRHSSRWSLMAATLDPHATISPPTFALQRSHA